MSAAKLSPVLSPEELDKQVAKLLAENPGDMDYVNFELVFMLADILKNNGYEVGVKRIGCGMYE